MLLPFFSLDVLLLTVAFGDEIVCWSLLEFVAMKTMKRKNNAKNKFVGVCSSSSSLVLDADSSFLLD